ncbi:MAG: type phosphodiesterase/nucleotide pyrophosphatase [Gemmatimonadetes bacterium]|nr:type phosphodiesterase/nucleotide pyrophosphatase [Gemmatimonadota bacterium]
MTRILPASAALLCAAAVLASAPLAAQTAPPAPASPPAASASPTPAPAAPPVRPTLVVLITVDQMRPDYLDRWAGQLTGGLARLRRGGAVFTQAYQDHAITETAPGHATTLSGRYPVHTGIVQNSAGVLDPQSPVVAGIADPASPFRFRGSALIDWMRTADPRSRALSVSRKDRGAILPLGRAHQSVFWYALDGRFTTSRYYADTLPAWVQRFNARQVPRSMAGRAWTPLLPDSAYAERDTVEIENGQPYVAGVHEVAFPHRLPADPDTAAKYFTQFPWMDQLTLDAAWTGLGEMRLGAGPQTDLLAVSLSTTDAVGHRYGPDSREMHDQILRLDRMLGAFLDSLYTVRDSSRVLIALTADHGMSSYPEVRPGGAAAAAYHVHADSAVADYMAHLAEAGVDTSGFAWSDGLVTVRPDAFAGASVSADTAIAGFARMIREVPGVLRADRMRDLRARGDTADYVSRRWLHMVPADVPIELVVTLQPGHEWGDPRWAEHGSVHDEDAHVPLVFYGAGVRPGRYGHVARVVDLAPTLARILGVAPTEPLDGHVLVEAVR